MGNWRWQQHWGLRAADSDREQVIEQLREHCAAGRLTLDEFEARLEEVWAARTYRDLHWVSRELPRLERRPSWAGLPIGRHVLANALVAGGWLAIDPNIDPLVPLPVLTLLVSATVLAIQARVRRRRIGRRGDWRVVAGDRWQITARPPRGQNVQAMIGGAQQWNWPGWQGQQQQRQPWPYPVPQPPGQAQPDRRSGTGT
jgi:Domain of unknown function (DUF1707)